IASIDCDSLSFSRAAFRHTRFAKSLVIAIDPHVANERMHCPHESHRETRSHPGHFGEIVMGLVLSSQLAQRSDENRIAGPLKAGLCQGAQRETHSRLIVANKIFSFRDAHEI